MARVRTNPDTVRAMRMRLEPEDDLLHPPDDDPNYNESRYYNFFADDGRFGQYLLHAVVGRERLALRDSN